MKTRIPLIIEYLTIGAILSLAITLYAQTPMPAASDGAEPVDPVEPAQELNATQLEKADRLSEASGVSREEILNMRMGITSPTTDPATDPDAVAPPQGKGWGVIAKWLGLHPGTLGKGTGDKFYPKDEDPTAGQDGILASRDKLRNSRLYKKNKGGDNPDETAMAKLKLHGNRSSDKQQTKIDRKAEKNQNRKLNRDRSRDKTNRGNGKQGKSGKGNNGNRGGKK